MIIWTTFNLDDQPTPSSKMNQQPVWPLWVLPLLLSHPPGLWLDAVSALSALPQTIRFHPSQWKHDGEVQPQTLASTDYTPEWAPSSAHQCQGEVNRLNNLLEALKSAFAASAKRITTESKNILIFHDTFAWNSFSSFISYCSVQHKNRLTE